MNIFEINSIRDSKFNIIIILFFFLVILGLIFYSILRYRKSNFYPVSEEQTSDNKTKNMPDKNLDELKNKEHELLLKEIENRNEQKKIVPVDEKKEVYNISENIYTYDDAPYVCKIFGGELATFEQLKDEFERGADWCNYGWSQGQNAYYPTQKKSWQKLQESDKNKDMCGVPGINGGYFANPDLKFGVNCYGVKPNKTEENSIPVNQDTYKTPEQLEAERRTMEFESKKKDIQILPFNNAKWSLNQETGSKSFIANNSVN